MKSYKVYPTKIITQANIWDTCGTPEVPYDNPHLTEVNHCSYFYNINSPAFLDSVTFIINML